MKHAFLTGFLASLSVTAVDSQTTEDDAAVHNLAAGFSAARNAFDAKALANLYTEDAHYTRFDGQNVRGRAAIEKSWAEAFQQPGFKNTQSQREVTSVKFLRPDVAVVTVTGQLSGFAEARTPMDIYVMTKAGSDWKIASHHLMRLVPPASASRSESKNSSIQKK